MMNAHEREFTERGLTVQYRTRREHRSRTHSMQLPDESIAYRYQSLLVPAVEEWTPAAELRGRFCMPAAKIKELEARCMQVRSRIVTERELRSPPAEMLPLDAGFIDLPQKTLDQH